jgi:hypothetical protein
VGDEVIWATSTTGEDFQCVHVADWREAQVRISNETQRRERFEEEVESAHKWLDDRAIPRVNTGGEVFSLVGRMMRLSKVA